MFLVRKLIQSFDNYIKNVCLHSILQDTGYVSASLHLSWVRLCA